jgi:hypothetical protein
VKGLVTEGCTYEVENVLVTRNDPKFQTTRHRYKLNLLHNTSWKRLDDDAIPNYHFDFVNFMVIVQSKNEGQYVGKKNDTVLKSAVIFMYMFFAVRYIHFYYRCYRTYC